MTAMILAYAALSFAAAAAAAAASSNGTMYASEPGLWNDPCVLGCLTASTCPGRDKSCLCDNFDLVTSDASTGCIRNGCPNVKADDVVGQLRAECSGRKMMTIKGSPVMASQESSTSVAAVESSPTVKGVDSVGGSSLPPPSPSPTSPSSPSSPLSPAATEGISTTASTNSPVLPVAAAASSPGASTSTAIPSVISNTHTLSPLPSQLSALVVATSTPEMSTASTTRDDTVGGSGGDRGSGSNTAASSPKGTPNTTSPTSDEEPSSHDSELSPAAKAGIGISITIACLSIIAAVFFFGWRRRRGDRNSGLGEDTISWLRHAGEKHRTLQAIPAFGPTSKTMGGGTGGARHDGHDGPGVGSLAMSLGPSSHLTYLSLGSEPSARDEMHGIGMALSSDIYDSLDSQTLIADEDSETRWRDGDLDSPVIPRFVVPHGNSFA